MDDEALITGLKALTTNIDIAVTIVDLTGRVLEWNPEAERLYNIKREMILGQEITGFFDPTSLLVRQVMIGGTKYEAIYNEPRPGIRVLVTAVPLVVNGRLIGAMAAERDVTRTSPALASAADEDPFKDVMGRSPQLMQAVAMARRIAPTEVVTIVRGESGTGKELFAQAIHLASQRAKGPFIALNCGAIPQGLFESELFGYAPGAFTGANPKGQIGKLELAEGGTLFLDEVGDLPIESQVKLLRVLEERKFFRVGGTTPVTVDVRVIVATHRPLEEMVREGTFRGDLYWRINVVSLNLPPLRGRKEDVNDLVQSFIQKFSLQYMRPVSGVDPDVMRALLEYPWPGNVRELRNVIERLIVLSQDRQIRYEMLPEVMQLPAVQAVEAAAFTEALVGEAQEGCLQAAITKVEREEILAALQAAGANRSRAAGILGVSRATLYNKCKRLGITRRSEAAESILSR